MSDSKFDMSEKLSNDLFNAITNQTTEGITVADMDGNYLYTNQAFCNMSGYSEQELLTKTVFEMKAENQSHQSFYDSKEKYEGVALRVNLQRKDGTEYLTEIIGDIIVVDGTKQVLGTIRDISDNHAAEMKITELNKSLESKVEQRTSELRKTIEDLNNEIIVRQDVEMELKESLEVKQVLLKEVTHRVKNNLQVISSILNLQKASSESEETKLICEETANRIQSMALIHETLYSTNGFSKVNFKEYIDSLVTFLCNVFEVPRSYFSISVANSNLSIDAATCCGMIVSELITNSLKYAFDSSTDTPRISITLSEIENGSLELTVADNGIGLPKALNIAEVDTLGLQLVSSLVEQIDGEYKIDKSSGTSFSIVFKDKLEEI